MVDTDPYANMPDPYAGMGAPGAAPAQPPVAASLGIIGPRTGLVGVSDRERFLNPDLYPVGAKGETVGENLKNIAQRGGVGLFSLADALVNPGRTVRGIASTVLPDEAIKILNKAPGARGREIPLGSPNPVQSFGQVVSGGPWQVAGNVAPIVAQSLAGEVLPEMAGAIRSDVVKAPGGVARFLTNTRPGVTAGLVEDVTAANKAVEDAAQKHLERTQGALQARTGKISTAEQMDAAKARLKHEEAVRETEEANREATAQAEGKTATAQGEFFKKKAEHEAEARRTQAENERVAAQHELEMGHQQDMERLLNRNERQAKVDLKKVGDRVHDDADRMYEKLKPRLANVESDPETIATLSDHLYGQIDQATAKSPVYEKFQKLVKNKSGALTYADLEDFRSAMGRAMNGRLPGPTYHLYKVMLDGDEKAGVPGIIDEMDRIAASKKLKPQADAARASWRAWAESFRDPGSPVAKILDDPEQHGLLQGMRGQQSYLNRLRRFGPDGQELADSIERDLSLADSSKATYSPYGGIRIKPPEAPKPTAVKPFAEEPPLPTSPKLKSLPRAEPLQLTSGSPEVRAGQILAEQDRAAVPNRPEGERQLIGPEQVRQAKRESLAAKEKKIRTGWSPVLSSISIYDAIKSGIEGNWSRVGLDLGARGIYEVGKQGFAAMLRNPAVIKLLTEPTAADLAQIPAELRGPGFKTFLDSAKTQGVRVDPRLYALASAAPAPKTQPPVAAALTAVPAPAQ